MSDIQAMTESYRQKTVLLEPWMPSIMAKVKKDLRQEHLAKDRPFCNKYFPSQNIHRLQPVELAQAYSRAIAEEEQGEQIAEFVFHRWLLKHTDVYHFFEKELTAITPDFTALERLTVEQGRSIQERARGHFDAEAIYLFSVVNGVVFDASVMEELREEALKLLSKRDESQVQDDQQKSWEKKIQDSEMQIARLTDRYEKKLAGWERKYDQDIAALKKQIAQLQRQLQEKR